MKKIKTANVFPMPVLMIASYCDDGSVDVMNAAWGTMVETDVVVICLSANHKTVENIKKRKAFSVSLADEKHMVEADYFGVVSAHKDGEKFLKSGLTAIKAEKVEAPIIEEFPVALECELIKRDEETGLTFGKIVNSFAREEVLTDGKVDIDKLGAITFDPFTLGYYKVGKRVGNAFRDGVKLK